MILGGGIYQVPLIRKAKEMGLETLVVSIPGNYPGIPLADRFYDIDTRDHEKILETAEKEQIHGICTSGTDLAVRGIGYVNTRLGLSGIGEEAAKLVTDKLLMKEAFRNGEVSTAAFEKVTSIKEAEEAADKIGYPVMVKAVDSSGSRGITKAEQKTQLEEAFQEAFQITKKEYVLVEEFIEAEEIGIDGFVGEKGLEAFYPHEKFTYSALGHTVPVGHGFPLKRSEALMKELRLQMEKAAKALGLKNCPFNADVFVKGNRAWVIEMGGRTGATCIPELISIYTGEDWYEKILRAALGEKPDFREKETHPCMAKLIFSPVDGKIKSIDEKGMEQLRQENMHCHLDYEPGQKIEAMKNGTDRIGHIYGAVSDEASMDRYVSRLRSCVTLEEGNLEDLWKK